MQNEVNVRMKMIWMDLEFQSSHALIQLSELILFNITPPCLNGRGFRGINTNIKVVLTIKKPSYYYIV